MPCLVVGGGRVAAGKVRSLLDAGAEVTVIAPEMSAEIEALPARRVRRRYARGDVEGYFLAIAATASPEVNRLVYEDGEERRVLVNGADDVAACRFFMPAVLRRGTVTVAVSTAGASPYLAAYLKRRLSGVVGEEIGELAELLASARTALRSGGRSSEAADWASLPLERIAALLAEGHREEAEETVARWLEVQRA